MTTQQTVNRKLDQLLQDKEHAKFMQLWRGAGFAECNPERRATTAASSFKRAIGEYFARVFVAESSLEEACRLSSGFPRMLQTLENRVMLLNRKMPDIIRDCEENHGGKIDNYMRKVALQWQRKEDSRSRDNRDDCCAELRPEIHGGSALNADLSLGEVRECIYRVHAEFAPEERRAIFLWLHANYPAAVLLAEINRGRAEEFDRTNHWLKGVKRDFTQRMRRHFPERGKL